MSDMEQIITEMFKNGSSVADIQRSTRKSRPFIVKVLQEAGLKSRDKNPAYCRGVGSSHPSWKGRCLAWNGYIRVKRPDHPRALSNGYVWEHILVLEEKIGRPLEYYGKGDSRNECVHHINGDKTDNRPENLELQTSNSAHHKHEWSENPHKYPQSKVSQDIAKERYELWRSKNDRPRDSKGRFLGE